MKRLFRCRLVSLVVIVAIAFTMLVPSVALAGTVVQVGGGTWSYGREFYDLLSDLVYSHYKHNTKDHSATAIFGSKKDFDTAAPGYWAEANAVNWFTVSGSAVYWNTW